MTDDIKTKNDKETDQPADNEPAAIKKISEHAFFDNGRLLLKGHPDTDTILEGIAYAQKVASIRMQEHEELILMQVEKRLDEAFYTLWCREANDFFRLSLRYRRRAAKLIKKKEAAEKEIA